MTRYFIAPDGYEQPCIWNDDGLVLRKADLSGPHEELLWRVVTGVLAPDEATLERLARRFEAQHDLRFVSGAELPSCQCGDDLKDMWLHDIRAALAALADPAETGGESWKSR